MRFTAIQWIEKLNSFYNNTTVTCCRLDFKILLNILKSKKYSLGNRFLSLDDIIELFQDEDKKDMKENLELFLESDF